LAASASPLVYGAHHNHMSALNKCGPTAIVGLGKE
jgi:hypothetical protein